MSDERSNVHPYKCPVCENTIRATNTEWWVSSEERIYSSYETMTPRKDAMEQLFYCPNESCRIKRLLPDTNE